MLKPLSCRSAVRSTPHMPMTLVRLPVNESLVMLVVSAAKDGQEALSIFKSTDRSHIDQYSPMSSCPRCALSLLKELPPTQSRLD